ncbi:PLDc N-terminal domain-containing protein [Leifsonia shinshuensis]|uniref:Cardiolipin synthase N-terminal domain-containing protein n=1 Tax=Leifsonia shinshuensis TaxID=150026 RepID=A0A7G6Y7Y2_9MICO|nr:PLDc N-terminal domain-containing protein [Leifsonia shinshuensis]QNE34597.1 hypothetical protein F1C12_05310 [Leifsonia shinshuensis]
MELVFVLAGFAALIVIGVFVAVAIVQILKQPFLHPLVRLAWVVAAIAFPVLGPVAWFALGDRRPLMTCLPPR